MGKPVPIQKTQSKEQKIKELESMLLAMTQGIVDSPEEIMVFPGLGEGFVHFEVRCSNSDAGTLIGTRGIHAEAIRTLMTAAGAVRKIRVTLLILAKDGNQYTPK